MCIYFVQNQLQNQIQNFKNIQGQKLFDNIERAFLKVHDKIYHGQCKKFLMRILNNEITAVHLQQIFWLINIDNDIYKTLL